MDAWISCQESPSPNPSNPNGHWIVYDLKERYSIEQMKLWNVNDPAHLDWGIKDFILEYSGNYMDWFKAGEFQLEKATGISHYEGMDWINVRMPEARYVLITAISNYGKSDCYGFAEVRFSAEKTIISETNKVEDSNFSAIIYPNPAQDQFLANINGITGDEIEFSCFDMFGHRIEQGKIKLTKSNYLLRVISTNWLPGQYQFVIKSKQHIKRYSVVKM